MQLGLVPDNPAGALVLAVVAASSSLRCCTSRCWPCSTPDVVCWSLTTWHAISVKPVQPAVCPCLQALVSAQWPVQLQMHRKTRTLTLSTLLKVSTAAAASRAATFHVDSRKSLEMEEPPKTPGKKTVVWEQQSLDAPGELDLKEVSWLYVFRSRNCAARLGQCIANRLRGEQPCLDIVLALGIRNLLEACM